MHSSEQAHLVVRIAGHRRALDIAAVDEVLRMAWVTDVPRSPAEVCGVLNVHGQVLAVLDPEVLLDGPSHPPRSSDYLVVVGLAGARVVLKVEAIEGLVEGVRAAPPAESAAPPFVIGHLLVDDEPVPVLDVEQLISAELRAEVLRLLEDGDRALAEVEGGA